MTKQYEVLNLSLKSSYIHILQCFSTFLQQRNPTQVSKSLTEPHAMFCESSGVGEVEVSECLGANVSSKSRKTSVVLKSKPPKANDKTAGKAQEV